MCVKELTSHAWMVAFRQHNKFIKDAFVAINLEKALGEYYFLLYYGV